MLADEVDFAIGVDPHRDRHALALVSSVGGVIAQTRVNANAAGYRDALAFGRAQAPGQRIWAVEGTGSYGRGLVRSLEAVGERVVEVGRLAVGGRAKSDELDAVWAARSVLARRHAGQPRSDGTREALRVLLIARQGESRPVGLDSSSCAPCS
jgi:transposase